MVPVVDREKENPQQALHQAQRMQWQGPQVLQRDPVAIGLGRANGV